MSAPPLRLVALCRMSVAYDDLGNQRQEDFIRDHATRRGMQVVAVKKDVMSATKFRLNDRPGWREALAMVQAKLADAIGVYHIDRLTRDNRDLEDVIDTKIPVVCASGEIDLTTDMGRTLARILTAIAKGETERKAARQRLANLQRFNNQLPHAGGPRAFGYEQNGMTIVDDEAEAFRWASQQALAGSSLRGIAKGLATAGMASSRAKYSGNAYGWTHGGIKKMLTNPRYAGLRVFNGQQVVGLWPKLIELDTHLALARELGRPERDPLGGRPGRNSRSAQNLLTLVAVCDKCGSPLIAGRGGVDPRYTCRSKKGCIYPPREPADEYVTDHILALISQPTFLDALTPHSDERVAAAKAQIDKYTRRLSVYNDDFNEGIYEGREDEYRRATRDLSDKLKAQEAVIDGLSERELFFGESWQLDVGTEAVNGQWDQVPLTNRRAIIARFLEVRVKPAERKGRFGRAAWDAEQSVIVRRRSRLAVA